MPGRPRAGQHGLAHRCRRWVLRAAGRQRDLETQLCSPARSTPNGRPAEPLSLRPRKPRCRLTRRPECPKSPTRPCQSDAAKSPGQVFCQAFGQVFCRTLCVPRCQQARMSAPWAHHQKRPHRRGGGDPATEPLQRALCVSRSRPPAHSPECRHPAPPPHPPEPVPKPPGHL